MMNLDLLLPNAAFHFQTIIEVGRLLLLLSNRLRLAFSFF